MTDTAEFAALFEELNNALQAGDPQQVAALYDTDAILLPTFSNNVRHSHLEIEDYFARFKGKGVSVSIDESNVRVFGNDNVMIGSGVYTFKLADEARVQARFTLVYRWNGERWMIVEHHSSTMPEG